MTEFSPIQKQKNAFGEKVKERFGIYELPPWVSATVDRIDNGADKIRFSANIRSASLKKQENNFIILETPCAGFRDILSEFIPEMTESVGKKVKVDFYNPTQKLSASQLDDQDLEKARKAGYDPEKLDYAKNKFKASAWI